WDLVGPERSPRGCWEMAVSATAPIPAGASLLLSYGERSSDDFLVHYGFVPSLSNPHEDAVVFEDVGEALEWHHVQYAAQLSDEAAEAIYSRAYSAALQEQKLSGWSARQQQEASRRRTAAQTRAGPLLLDLWALYEDAKGCGMMEEAEQTPT
ncbi:SET domain-containing protein, partial [Haematococcus lacustris]